MLQVEAGTHVAKLQQPLSVLDQHLSKQTYLVGQSVSLADVIVAVDLIPAFQKVCSGALGFPSPSLKTEFSCY